MQSRAGKANSVLRLDDKFKIKKKKAISMREKWISKKIYYTINHCSRKSLLWLTSQLNSPKNKFVAWKWWGLLTMKQFPSKLYLWSSSKYISNIFLSAHFLPVYVPHNSFISSALPPPKMWMTYTGCAPPEPLWRNSWDRANTLFHWCYSTINL